MEKLYRAFTPKHSAIPLLKFGKQPKTAIACKKEILLKIRYLQIGLSKIKSKIG